MTQPFLSGYLFEESENTTSERYMHHCVHCNIIYNNQYMETTTSTDSQMDKEDIYIDRYNGIFVVV